MFDKLEALEERFDLVNQKLSDPDIITNQEEFKKYCKENSDLTPIIEKYREYKTAKETIAECKEILASGDHLELIKMIKAIYAQKKEREAEGKRLHMSDEHFMRDAEQLLYNEWQYVLNVDKAGLIAYIFGRLESNN